MAEHIVIKFPVISVLYQLESEDEEYQQSVDETVEDIRRLLKGDLSPYKAEGENSPVRLRVFTKRC
jgi:hypothetical protein